LPVIQENFIRIGDILVLLANFLPGNVTTYTVYIVGLSINIVFINARSTAIGGGRSCEVEWQE